MVKVQLLSVRYLVSSSTKCLANLSRISPETVTRKLNEGLVRSFRGNLCSYYIYRLIRIGAYDRMGLSEAQLG